MWSRNKTLILLKQLLGIWIFKSYFIMFWFNLIEDYKLVFIYKSYLTFESSICILRTKLRMAYAVELWNLTKTSFGRTDTNIKSLWTTFLKVPKSETYPTTLVRYLKNELSALQIYGFSWRVVQNMGKLRKFRYYILFWVSNLIYGIVLK